MTRKNHALIELLNDLDQELPTLSSSSDDLSAIQLFHKLPQLTVLKELLCERLSLACARLSTRDGRLRFYVAEHHPLCRDLLVFNLVFHPTAGTPHESIGTYDQTVDGVPLGAFHLQPELSFVSYCIQAEEKYLSCFDGGLSVFTSLVEILNHALSNCAYVTELTQNRKQFSNYLRKWTAMLNDPIYLNYLIVRKPTVRRQSNETASASLRKRQRMSWEL